MARRRVSDSTVAEEKEVDRAARSIQRFFLMVKAEVDREIHAEKRRRKSRKKQKRRKDGLDDKMLESVWRKTIEEDCGGSDNIRRAREAAANALGGKKLRRSGGGLTVLTSRGSEDSRTKKPQGLGLDPVLTSRGSEDSRAKKPLRLGLDPALTSRGSEDSRAKKPLGLGLDPIRAATSHILSLLQLAGSSRFFEDEKATEGSGYSQRNYRAPSSRLTTLSPREAKDDLNLEEAWIDSKIHNAKERRRADRRSAKRSAPRHHRTPSSLKQTISSDRLPPRRAQEV